MQKTSFSQLRLDKTKEQMMQEYFALWQPTRETETVSLDNATGRVLVSDAFSLYDLPVKRASAMDGVCVKSAMFADGIPDTSAWKLGTDYLRADTGDDFDDAFDSVIAIESVEIDGDAITLDPTLEFSAGMNVRPRGSMLKKADLLVRGGKPLRALDIAALAMGGYANAEVYRRPRVAFIPTGSELIPPGAPLERGNNFDSNSLLVKNYLTEIGAEPICYPIVRDSMHDLRAALSLAMEQADIVLINGGSAKGSEDFNTRLLQERGQVYCHGVPAGPGRPLCMAVLDGKPVVNVPGPSLGTFFSLHWCVSRIVERFLNLPERENPKITGVLAEDLRCPPHFDFLVRLNVRRTDTGFALYPVGARIASIAAVSSADAMFVSLKGESLYEKGSELTVELLQNVAFLEKE